ncbi:hypothetical protein EV121DRAFT_274366 [Schizophyllum commune]
MRRWRQLSHLAAAKKHKKKCNVNCKVWKQEGWDTLQPVEADVDVVPSGRPIQPLTKDRDRRMTVVFVPDPVLGKDTDRITADHGAPHVTVINVTSKQANELRSDASGAWAQKLPDSVHADTEPDPTAQTVKVAQWEWVHVVPSLRALGHQVVALPYETFIGAMLEPKAAVHAKVLHLLERADVVLGGPPLHKDLRDYGVSTIRELDEYLASARQLSRKAVIFPDPWELMYSSSLPLVDHILDLASAALGGVRPYTAACHGCTPDDPSHGLQHMASPSSDKNFVIVREDGEESVRPENLHLRRMWVKDVPPDRPSMDWLGMARHVVVHRKCSPSFGELKVVKSGA